MFFPPQSSFFFEGRVEGKGNEYLRGYAFLKVEILEIQPARCSVPLVQ